MSPTTERIKLPEGHSLQRRAVCSPRTDELPTLRDREGRVLALVEAWRPADGAN